MDRSVVLSAAAFFIALGVSSLLVPPIAHFARLWGWLDRPAGIKRHTRETPYGGGLAIIGGSFLSLILLHGFDLPGSTLWILLSSALVLLGGAWDDWRPLAVVPKLALQTLAAALLAAADLRLKIEILPVALNYVLTILWLVGMTNAVNIIDIMDGLCGGVCGVAALAFGVIGILTGDPALAVLGMALSGAIAGFLVFNFEPARIFMGDTGAQFIGFTLAASALQGSYTAFNDIALLAPVLILGIPIYDTALVSFFRLRRGASPFHGSPDHLALRLRKMGWSVPATVRICILATALLCAVAAAAVQVNLGVALSLYGAVLVMALFAAVRLSRVDIEADVARPATEPGRRFLVGVTGSIGAGKTTFCTLLSKALHALGKPAALVLDADMIAREVLDDAFGAVVGKPDSIAEKLVARFGNDIVTPAGSLDRRLLAARAFADDASAAALNAIVHPVVREICLAMTRERPGIYILDVPLLFEAGFDRDCDVTIAVVADDDKRRSRAARFEDFENRQARQWTQKRKALAAKHVVENNGTLDDLYPKAVEIAKKLL